MKPFAGETALKRWVFIPVSIYPDEQKDGLAGWRAQITKLKTTGKANSFFIKMGTFPAVWFNETFTAGLTFLSD